MSAPGKWYPFKHWGLLWRVERAYYRIPEDTLYTFQAYHNDWVRTYWTRAQAQAAADELNKPK